MAELSQYRPLASTVSPYRLKMRRLLDEEEELANVLMGRKPLLKGTVYQMKTKCGKEGCKCQREGELHTAWRISRSHKGGVYARYLKEERDILKGKQLTENYRRFRRARADLIKVHREQIKLVDLLEKGRREKDF